MYWPTMLEQWRSWAVAELSGEGCSARKFEWKIMIFFNYDNELVHVIKFSLANRASLNRNSWGPLGNSDTKKFFDGIFYIYIYIWHSKLLAVDQSKNHPVCISCMYFNFYVLYVIEQLFLNFYVFEILCNWATMLNDFYLAKVEK